MTCLESQIVALTISGLGVKGECPISVSVVMPCHRKLCVGDDIGSIPSAIAELTAVTSLALDGNLLTGISDLLVFMVL